MTFVRQRNRDTSIFIRNVFKMQSLSRSNLEGAGPPGPGEANATTACFAMMRSGTAAQRNTRWRLGVGSVGWTCIVSSILVFSFTVINNLLDCQPRSQSYSVLQLHLQLGPPWSWASRKLYNRFNRNSGHGSINFNGYMFRTESDSFEPKGAYRNRNR